MSELQKMFARLRSQGYSRAAAIGALAEMLGVDSSTIHRQLERARGEDARRSRNPHHSRPLQKKEAPQ